jgi:peptide/nickel transport system ATP-binding protein
VSTPLLAVEDLNVSFNVRTGEPVHAVRDVSFTLEAGERMGLVGESGCGKSTTLYALMGLLPPNAMVSGRVLVDGVDVLAEGEASVEQYRWTDIAMVFQGAMNAFNPVKTIGWQIAEPMEVHGTATGKAAMSRVRELLELVGISGDRAERYPFEFSGGMRQRAALAMALACDPKILLADEPTTALDVMVQAQILELLEHLTDELGLTMILVTHDLPMVTETCKRAAIMYAGEIVEVGPTSTLYRDPRHVYTRMLFGAMPDIDEDRSVISIPGTPPRLDRVIVGCAYADRCDQTMDVCRVEAPRQASVGPNHLAWCHLNDGDRVAQAAQAEGVR